MDMYKKKVLIISPNSFGGKKGGSILMRTLFGDWPQESVMSIHTEYTSSSESPTKNEHRVLGKMPLRTYPKRWLGLISGRVESFDGVFLFFPTSELKDKVESFKPDFIYTQLGPPFMMKMVLWLHKKYNIPVISHVMDDFIYDWPVSGHSSRMWLPFKEKLNSYAKNIFEKCINSSSVRLVISPSMAKEYEERYQCSFDVLNNGANVKFWQKKAVVERGESKGAEKIVSFAGSISESTNSKSVSMAVDAVEKLYGHGVNIRFRVASHKIPNDLLDKINSCKATEYVGGIEFESMPDFLAESSLVLLPFNFDNKSIGFCQYSWPTKLSECLATGTPILYVGPPELGFSQYLEENKLAICSYANSCDELSKNIFSCFEDDGLLFHISSNALKASETDFSVEASRLKIMQSINKVLWERV